MAAAWKIVTDLCLVDILQYLHVRKCNLLILQYSLVARSAYEQAAYQLEIIYKHRWLMMLYSSLLHLQCAPSVIYLLCDGQSYQSYG